MRRIQDLTGQRFGKLIALRRERVGNRSYWWCQCDCGRESRVEMQALKRGATKSCGCMRANKSVYDITGQRFGRLVVLERSAELRNQVSVWRCQCNCGSIVKIKRQHLVDGFTKSCGCLQKEKAAAHIKEALGQINGTNVSLLKSKKARLGSISGVRGVTWHKGNNRWSAQIILQGKRYYLGSFRKLSDAEKVIEEAREQIYGPFIEWYETYKTKQMETSSKVTI